MLARYLKAQLIVLICGGLVGPIFLITYFALPGMFGSFGPDVDSMAQKSTQWMLWVGALITVADVLVALWLADRGARSSAKSAALHQTGVLATAQIMGVMLRRVAIRCPASSINRRRSSLLRAISKPNSSFWSAAAWSDRSSSSRTSRCPACLVIRAGLRIHGAAATQWMLWVGLLITVADLLVAVWLANRGAKSSAKSAALHQTGVLATAQIIGLAETGMRINERPVVRLDLHITGPGFDFSDRKRVTVDISKQAIVTARKLVVLVDPNTHEYEIEWQASALIAGVVPAQFTSTEDNTTYDLSGQAGPLMEILQIYKANNLPFSGTVDIRNYPAVRQQIMAVVRRAAAQQPTPAAAGGVAAPPQQSAAQRLDELEKLHASGALSDAEYTAARQKIIADI